MAPTTKSSQAGTKQGQRSECSMELERLENVLEEEVLVRQRWGEIDVNSKTHLLVITSLLSLVKMARQLMG